MGVKGVSQLPVVDPALPGTVECILRQKDILTASDKTVMHKEFEE